MGWEGSFQALPVDAGSPPIQAREKGGALWWYQDHGGEEFLLDHIAFSRLAVQRIHGVGAPDPADVARYAANGARWLSV